jgi:tetratricopeptide (TPR) repeat protein
MPADLTPVPFACATPVARSLTHQEELRLYRDAYARNPGSPQVRLALAGLLVLLDHFAEAAALLDSWGLHEGNVDATAFFGLGISARMALNTPSDDQVAQALVDRALGATDERESHPAMRAGLLISQAGLALRRRDTASARVWLLQALSADPLSHDGFRRLTALELDLGHAEVVLELANERLRDHTGDSAVLAAKVLALAQLGRIDEARETEGLARFLRELEPEPPDGWATLADFNRDLAAEIGTHPGIRFGRHGAASLHTWRIDKPVLQRTPATRALFGMLRREAVRYALSLPAHGHPFLEQKPTQAELGGWCVITEGEGHESWHLHEAWLSGSYYLQVPDRIAEGSGPPGCIAFGLPEHVVGEAHAKQFGEVLCRPRTGLLLLFPSHIYHRTYPREGSERRVCCAFDVRPIKY